MPSTQLIYAQNSRITCFNDTPTRNLAELPSDEECFSKVHRKQSSALMIIITSTPLEMARKINDCLYFLFYSWIILRNATVFYNFQGNKMYKII